MLFNDVYSRYAKQLQEEIDKIPGIDRVPYPPKVINQEIDVATAVYFQDMRLIPSFTFIV